VARIHKPAGKEADPQAITTFTWEVSVRSVPS
jgi:hypothetical protein